MTGPDYSSNDPGGWCGDPKRGAALGRGGPLLGCERDAPVKLYLRRVRLDRWGYDALGTYWGNSHPHGWLFWATDEDSQTEVFVRAHTRAQAKAEVRKTLPNARFYR